jgi:hypothetical protein
VSQVIQLSGARRRVVRHRRGVFECVAVLQVRGDPGRAERVIADGRADAPASARLSPYLDRRFIGLPTS